MNKPTYHDTIVRHMQTCNTCFIEKPFSEYYTYARNKSGYQYRCKKCVKEYNQKRWIDNKDYMYSVNRKWIKDNPEKIKEYGETYHKNNPEKRTEFARDWRSRNKERVCELSHRRRMRRKANGIYVITDKELKKLYTSPCAYCGSTDNITADHVVPISRGGAHSIGNLLPACGSCNSSKKDRLLTEWRRL